MLHALEHMHSKNLVHMDVKVQLSSSDQVEVSMTLRLAFAWPCVSVHFAACCVSCRAAIYLWI